MDLDTLKAAFLQPAATLVAVQKVMSDAVRERSLEALGKMVDAHLLTCGLLGSTLLASNGKLVEFDQAHSLRDAL